VVSLSKSRENVNSGAIHVLSLSWTPELHAVHCAGANEPEVSINQELLSAIGPQFADCLLEARGCSACRTAATYSTLGIYYSVSTISWPVCRFNSRLYYIRTTGPA
jgi:hypothetical protein